jgi:aminoglycoside phosphotransferase (APT) family kinase protein
MLPQSQDDALAMTRHILGMMNLNDLPLSVKAHTQNWVFDTTLPDGTQAIIRLKAFPVPEGTQILPRQVLRQMVPGMWSISYPGSTVTQRPEFPAIEGIQTGTHIMVQQIPSSLWGVWPSEGAVVFSSFSSACEVHALRLLSRRTSLAIPRPYNNFSYGLSELVIFSYVPGEPRTPQTLTLKEAALSGAFLARLHTESHRLIRRSPTDPTLNAEGLLGPTSRYASPDERDFLSEEDRNLLKALHERLAQTETLLGPNSEHILLLHGDYLLQNILFDGETVGAIDFEMCGWGADLYDLATYLWQLKPLPNYQKFADAFWKGYTFWRELPPREWLEVFIAARQGASVRWLIQNRDLPNYADRVPGLIRQRMDEIADFLETDVLTRH